MKYVVAIVKPFKLDEVRDALMRVGVHGLTVTETKGYVGRGGIPRFTAVPNTPVNVVPKVKIEVAVRGDQLAEVIEAISGAAKTGQIRDGKVFTFGLEQAERIRTGEVGIDAL